MIRFFKYAYILIAIACVTASSVSAQELRGAWVTAWTAAFFTPEEADATVAAAKKANLNALFIQVRKNGDAYYDSATEPRGSEIAPWFDPLAYVIQKAHAEGIEVHAWMNAGRLWAAKEPPTDPRHIVNRHPEWLNVNNAGEKRATEGLYLDIGIPDAREYVASVAEEIARKYDVDGIHLDYIRYPGKEWGYSEPALARYNGGAKPEPNDPKWLQWRRDQVTALVVLVRERVRAARPRIVLSVSAIPWGDCPADFCDASPYTKVCQDWKKWAVEGLVDAVLPMNYKSEKNAKSAREFRNWLAGFAKWRGGRPVYTGIYVPSNEVADVVRQIEAVRNAKLDGFVLFSFNATEKRAALVDGLRAGPCSKPASPRGTKVLPGLASK